MAELLHPSGVRETVAPRNGKAFKLEELQAHVGGYVEAVTLADGRVMFVDEMGKLKSPMPLFNGEATKLFAVNRAWPDPIVGRALVCSKAEAGEDEG